MKTLAFLSLMLMAACQSSCASHRPADGPRFELPPDLALPVVSIALDVAADSFEDGMLRSQDVWTCVTTGTLSGVGRKVAQGLRDRSQLGPVTVDVRPCSELPEPPRTLDVPVTIRRAGARLNAAVTIVSAGARGLTCEERAWLRAAGQMVEAAVPAIVDQVEAPTWIVELDAVPVDLADCEVAP